MGLQSTDQRTLEFYDLSEITQTIPNIVSLMRLIVLPHIVHSFNHQITIAAFSLFLFSIGTDIVDGFAARKLKAASEFGAYLDVTIDFIFVFGLYLNFTIKGLYSPWILLIMVFVFSQFIISNVYSKQTIYDPIGKYYGSILFAGIGTTLLFPHPLTYQTVTFGIAISTAASLISRLTYFLRKKQNSR